MEDQATSREVRSWTVPAERAGVRVDAFVRECLSHLSRRQAEAALRAGLFSIRGRVAQKGERLEAGVALRFSGPMGWLAERPAPKRGCPLQVVYEDSAILAVNKPAGVPTHGFSGRETDSLANRLLAEWPDLAKVGTSRWEPGLVHRLDRETSGVLVIAKNQHAFEHLRSQFRARRVKKIYRALVWGDTPARASIDLALAHDRAQKGRMRAVREPMRGVGRKWQALTTFRRLGKAAGMSLVEIDMKTGVTHQIRAHLAALGHPIVGDSLYGRRQAAFGVRRHFLHAHSLTMVHPESGQSLTIVAELPEELAEVFRGLQLSL